MHRTLVIGALGLASVLIAFAGCNHNSANREAPRRSDRIDLARDTTAGVDPAALSTGGALRFRLHDANAMALDHLAVESRRYESAARTDHSRTFEEQLLARSLRKSGRDVPAAEIRLPVRFRDTTAPADTGPTHPAPAAREIALRDGASVQVEITPHIRTGGVAGPPPAVTPSRVDAQRSIRGPELDEDASVKMSRDYRERLARPVAHVLVTAQVPPEDPAPEQPTPELGMIEWDWTEAVELKPVGGALFSAMDSL